MNPRVAAQLVNQSLLFFIILLLLLPSARAQRAMINSKQRISLFIKRAAGRILRNEPKLNIINGYIITLIYYLLWLLLTFDYLSTDAKELRLHSPSFLVINDFWRRNYSTLSGNYVYISRLIYYLIYVIKKGINYQWL